MGAITRGIAGNITTSGVFAPAAVNNASVGSVTSFASIASGGHLTLISTQTASSSASLDFTSGISSTYDVYLFKWINCHPSAQNVWFRFYASTNGGSSYGTTQTSSAYRAYQDEGGGTQVLTYYTDGDGAQTTSSVVLTTEVGNGNDNSTSGELWLHNPSSTTFLKNFFSNASTQYNGHDGGSAYQMHDRRGGFFDTTSAINACKFAMNVGNIDSGIVKMYGVKKS